LALAWCWCLAACEFWMDSCANEAMMAGSFQLLTPRATAVYSDDSFQLQCVAGWLLTVTARWFMAQPRRRAFMASAVSQPPTVPPARDVSLSACGCGLPDEEGGQQQTGTHGGPWPVARRFSSLHASPPPLASVVVGRLRGRTPDASGTLPTDPGHPECGDEQVGSSHGGAGDGWTDTRQMLDVQATATRRPAN